MLNISDSTAVATLETGSKVVKLVVPSLRKKLEFAVEHVSLPPSFKFSEFRNSLSLRTLQVMLTLPPSPAEVTGKLATPDVDNFQTDQRRYVDYTNGRIYVSESKDSVDATAVVSHVILRVLC